MILVFLLLNLLPLKSSDYSEAVFRGDEAFQKIDYPAAISAYEAALHEHPQETEILWRLARAYVCLGEVSGEADRSHMFNTAEEYARRCVAFDSSKAEGHTWLAGALGYEAWYSGVSDQIRIAHELLHELDCALALNPGDDIAYSIKGSFYRALGDVGWVKRGIVSVIWGSLPPGGYEESESALLKAIALAPRTMRHSYELGVLYLDMDRKVEARKVLQQASILPVQSAIDRPRLVKIRELLSHLDTN